MLPVLHAITYSDTTHATCITRHHSQWYYTCYLYYTPSQPVILHMLPVLHAITYSDTTHATCITCPHMVVILHMLPFWGQTESMLGSFPTATRSAPTFRWRYNLDEETVTDAEPFVCKLYNVPGAACQCGQDMHYMACLSSCILLRTIHELVMHSHSTLGKHVTKCGGKHTSNTHVYYLPMTLWDMENGGNITCATSHVPTSHPTVVRGTNVHYVGKAVHGAQRTNIEPHMTVCCNAWIGMM